MKKDLSSERSTHSPQRPPIPNGMQRLSFSEVRNVYLELFKRHTDWDLDFIHSEAQKQLPQFPVPQRA